MLICNPDVIFNEECVINLKDALENNLYLPYTGWGYYSREISVELENELQQVLLGREDLEDAFKRIDEKTKAIVEGN